MEEKTVTQKIKDDYGTLTFFCKKHDLNYRTFKQVLYGFNKSARIVEILKQHKYIKRANELLKDGGANMRADVQMSFNVKATCGYCVNLSFSTKCDWICLLDEDENITIDDIESCSCEKWKFNYSTLSTLRPDELEVKRVSSRLRKELE